MSASSTRKALHPCRGTQGACRGCVRRRGRLGCEQAVIAASAQGQRQLPDDAIINWAGIQRFCCPNTNQSTAFQESLLGDTLHTAYTAPLNCAIAASHRLGGMRDAKWYCTGSACAASSTFAVAGTAASSPSPASLAAPPSSAPLRTLPVPRPEVEPASAAAASAAFMAASVLHWRMYDDSSAVLICMLITVCTPESVSCRETTPTTHTQARQGETHAPCSYRSRPRRR